MGSGDVKKMEAPHEAIQENRHDWLKMALLITIPLITMVMWPAQKSEKLCPAGPSLVACPAGWLNYEGKCYFFSEEEGSWTSGQSFCASYGSSLVVIESETEKVFLLRYMGATGHWIGLWKDPHQTWKWADGSEFNTTLEVKGETGDCAFLTTGFAVSSDCHITRKWICSQPDAYTRSKSRARGE